MHSNSSSDGLRPTSTTDVHRDVLAGVDIGGTKTAVSIASSPAEILWREEFPTRPEDGPEPAVRNIEAFIQRGLDETEATLGAIGVSCGGPLDSSRGVIQQPPNLLTWVDVPIVSLLQSRFDVACALENDANAGALAEHRFGAGQGCQHMIFLTLGTGLGAGLILDGKLFHGATSMAGEIGHVRLSADGPMGYGKAGSVEGWASGGGMARYGAAFLRDSLTGDQKSLLRSKIDTLTAKDVGEALQAGDPMAAQIVESTGRRLGEALAILVDLFNPERLVIGGLALRFREHLLAPARKVLAQEALPASVRACNVVPAALGERIGDVAALCIAQSARNGV